MKELSQLMHATIDAIGTEKSKSYVIKYKNITTSDFFDLLYNQSLEHATDFKKLLVVSEVEFTKWCNSFNLEIQNNVISKYPHLKEIIDKSGQTPVVLISIILLFLLLLFASIYLFFVKGKKKVKAKTLENAVDSKSQSILSSASPAHVNNPKSDPINHSKVTSKAVSPSKSTGPIIDTTVNASSLNNNNPSSTKSNLLDLDDFVYKLRLTGFKVERIKNGKVFDQLLRLNDRGQLRWSNSFFSKPQHISTLVNAIEGDSNTSFILEFKNKTVHFKLKKSELPYTSTTMMEYFNAIVKKLVQDPNYIMNICKSTTGNHDNDIDDGASDVTVNNTPRTSSSFFTFSPSKKMNQKPSSALAPVKE